MKGFRGYTLTEGVEPLGEELILRDEFYLRLPKSDKRKEKQSVADAVEHNEEVQSPQQVTHGKAPSKRPLLPQSSEDQSTSKRPRVQEDSIQSSSNPDEMRATSAGPSPLGEENYGEEPLDYGSTPEAHGNTNDDEDAYYVPQDVDSDSDDHTDDEEVLMTEVFAEDVRADEDVVIETTNVETDVETGVVPVLPTQVMASQLAVNTESHADFLLRISTHDGATSPHQLGKSPYVPPIVASTIQSSPPVAVVSSQDRSATPLLDTRMEADRDFHGFDVPTHLIAPLRRLYTLDGEFWANSSFARTPLGTCVVIMLGEVMLLITRPWDSLRKKELKSIIHAYDGALRLDFSIPSLESVTATARKLISCHQIGKDLELVNKEIEKKEEELRILREQRDTLNADMSKVLGDTDVTMSGEQHLPH